jgi:hypothetical protein
MTYSITSSCEQQGIVVDRQSKRSRCLEIDDEFELGRLRYRNSAGFAPLRILST